MTLAMIAAAISMNSQTHAETVTGIQRLPLEVNVTSKVAMNGTYTPLPDIVTSETEQWLGSLTIENTGDIDASACLSQGGSGIGTQDRVILTHEVSREKVGARVMKGNGEEHGISALEPNEGEIMDPRFCGTLPPRGKTIMKLLGTITKPGRWSGLIAVITASQ